MCFASEEMGYYGARWQTSMNPFSTAALSGLEARRARIDAQIAEVRRMMGVRGPGRPKQAAASDTEGGTAQPAKKRKKRKLSPEGRAAIVAAAKKRWAALKKAKA